MKTVCNVEMCTGCMLCEEICPKKAVNVVDTIRFFHAVIDSSKCVDCGLCERKCPVKHIPQMKSPIIWRQGWVNDDELRSRCSSGGVAAAIEEAFVRNGGIVCSCRFKSGEYRFDFATDEHEIVHFLGSKYVKSNPHGIYKKILELLKAGQKVLFVGLPCQVAALKSYVGEGTLLYTIDVICHGTPSPQIVNQYLSCVNVNIWEAENIQFRRKNNFQLWIDNTSVFTEGSRDEYTLGYLNGLFYTENCYQCNYAKIKRVSDLTLGDSWGTELPDKEIDRGVSLVLSQSDKGSSLLKMADISLHEVNIENAIQNNKQLYQASHKHKNYDLFFQYIESGMNTKKAIRRCLPYLTIKQYIKSKLFYKK